jgi:hypothetical protein
VSEPLEPTEEQFRAVCRVVSECPDPVDAWNLIRDMVLEAAALACEDTDVVEARESYYAQLGDARATLGDAARAIRAMKGDRE